MSDAIHWYNANAADLSRRYESVAAETVHGWLVDLLPAAPALVLDVGAGTGRDAAWLASRGLECQFASNRDPLFASNRDPSGRSGMGLSP